MGIAERIVSERKILGISQADFASKAGVSLSSQKRYEKGERDPDSSYLMALARMGVDVGYLLSGVRVTDDLFFEKSAMQAVLYRLQKALLISDDEFEELISDGDRALRLLQSGQISGDAERFPDHATAVVEKWVKNATAINYELLVNTLQSFEQAVAISGVALNPNKKAQALAMLYRAFQGNGQVDQVMIDEAVKLAAT